MRSCPCLRIELFQRHGYASKKSTPFLQYLDSNFLSDCITPYEDFLISSVPPINGLFIATGGSYHRWKFLPIIGKCVVRVVDSKLDSRPWPGGAGTEVCQGHIYMEIFCPKSGKVRTGSGRNCNFIGIEVYGGQPRLTTDLLSLETTAVICSHQKFRCTLLLSCTIFCDSHMLCTAKRIGSTFYECLVLISSISNNSGSTHPFIVRTYSTQDVRHSSAIFG